jgi:hypothetical protein
MDRLEQDGRSTSESTVLYLDGKPGISMLRHCSGSQSSQRLDSRTVEFCASARRATGPGSFDATTGSELVLEITARQPDGRRVEWRLVLEKQKEGA